MNLIDVLQWRYAVKQFSDQKVPTSALRTLLDATRLSASSYGLQPYSLIVIESEALRERLLPFSYGQTKVAHCSHLVIFAAHTQIGANTVERYVQKHIAVTHTSEADIRGYADHMTSALMNQSPQQRQAWAHQQAYIALGTFLTSAAAMKIDSCPMTGFDVDGVDNVLGLADRHLTASILCPIGYRHDQDTQAHSPKVRFSHEEMVVVL